MALTAKQHAMTNNDIETSIGGYDIELTFDNDGGDFVSSCFVSLPGTEYASSLALLMGCGYIEDDHCGEHRISDAKRDRIEQWAIDNGY